MDNASKKEGTERRGPEEGRRDAGDKDALRDQAITAFKRVLELDRDHPQTHRDLGVAYFGKGDFKRAAFFLGKALALGLRDAGLYYHLGAAHDGMGSIDDAVAALRQAARQEPSPVQSGRIHAKLGTLLFEKGALGEAVKCLKKAHSLNPDDLGACLHLGLACDESGLREDAVLHYREAIALKPRPAVLAEILSKLSLLYLSFGLADDAMAAAREALRVEPDAELAHAVLGTAHLAGGRYEDAIAHLEKRARLSPDDVFTLHNLGAAFQYSARIRETLALCRNRLAKGRETSGTLALLGSCCLSLGRYDEAVDALQKSISRDPEHSRARFHLACAFEAREQMEEAVRAYRQYLASKPAPKAKDYLRLGQMCARQGLKNPAIEAFRQAIDLAPAADLRPSNVQSYALLGSALLEKKRFGEAAACLERSLVFDPQDARTLHMLGRVHLANGAYEKAMDAHFRAELLASDASRSPLALGEAYLGRGAHEEAVEVCLKIVEADPKNAKAYLLLAKAYAAKGLGEKAREAYGKVVAIEPDQKEARAELGAIHVAAGRWEDAINCLKKAVELNPQDVRSLQSLGKAYEGKGHTEKAGECFRQAKSIRAPSSNIIVKEDQPLPTEEELDATIADCKSLIEQAPRSREAYKALGRAYAYRGLSDESIYYLKKALKLDPEDAQTYVQLAAAYEAKDRGAAALACLEEALRRDPNNLEINLVLAERRIKAGDYDKASVHCERIQGSALEQGLAARLHACWAEICRSRGNYKEAKASYEFLIKGGASEDAAIYRSISECCWRAGEFSDTVRYAVKALESNPDDVEVHKWLSNAYCALGLEEKAEPYYLKAAEKNPRDSEALSELSLIRFLKRERLMEKGDLSSDEGRNLLEQAVSLGRRAIAVDPENPRANLALGGALLRRGDFKEAFRSLEKTHLDGASPLFSRLQLLLAQAYFAKGIPKRALECLEKVGKENRESASYYLLAAAARLVAGDLKASLACYQEVLRLDPGFATAFIAQGAIHALLGEYGEAIEAFKKSGGIRGASDLHLCAMSACMAASGAVKEAIDVLAKVGFPETDADVTDSIAKEALASGDYVERFLACATRALGGGDEGNAQALSIIADVLALEAALKIVRELLKEPPERVSVRALPYLIMAVAYREQGRHEMTLEACRRLLSIIPNDPLGFRLISNLEASPELIDVLNKTLETKPDDIRAATELAGIYVKNKDWDLALAYCQKVLAKEGDNPRANLYAGIVYLRKGWGHAAKSALEVAAQADPNGDWGAQARSKLEETDEGEGSEK